MRRIRLVLPQFFDAAPLRAELEQHPELWNRRTARTAAPDSPHRELDDIWLRYAAPGADASKPHVAEWYEPEAELLAKIRHAAVMLARRLDATDIGGVLITRIPAGATCHPHSDQGWHARFYEKFAIQVASNEEQAFHFEGEELVTQPGDVFWFDNAHTHWVTNPSAQDRITVIVCLRLPVGRTMNLEEAGVGIDAHAGGGVALKETTIPAGLQLEQHAHEYEHLSILARGIAEVTVDGMAIVYDATQKPVVITIAAGKQHLVKALTPVSWFCLHATEETDPDRADRAVLQGA